MQGPARLILVDQGLIGFEGHHLGYSSSLAEAAAARGIPALILANRAFQADLAGGSVQCLPTFEALYQTSVRRSPLRGVLYSLSSHLPANMATPLTRALRRARHSL